MKTNLWNASLAGLLSLAGCTATQNKPAEPATVASPVAIQQDKSFMLADDVWRSPTVLDEMDLAQFAQYRREKIKSYAVLNFYPEKYDPFWQPHRQIFKSVRTKTAWTAPAAYYIANPYILLSLNGRRKVTPFNMLLDGVDIVYTGSKCIEKVTGEHFLQWQEFVGGFKQELSVTMVNAWDCGFRYITLDHGKSRNVDLIPKPGNVSHAVFSQCNFFHVGRYKKNNKSRYDPRGDIRITDPEAPTRLVFKLWTNEPASTADAPDLIYEMDYSP